MKNHRICVVGLGYVGMPLAIALANKYSVVGFDIKEERIRQLREAIDITKETDPVEIKLALDKGLVFTHQIGDAGDCNIYIVTVPTPVDHNNQPDLNHLLSASKQIGGLLNKNDIVIYESTTYPGCTEEDCVPILEAASGLRYNIDFFCGYSPERINPGDKIKTLTKIKKVTSGSTPEVAEIVDQLYASIIEAGTHLAPSIKVAEASKAIENAQRDVNISFVNELALIFDLMDIDTQDVLEAAATKWNFLRFSPGLVGGHCISVDPYYLAHKAEKMGYHPAVILSGRKVNDSMAVFVANKVVKLMIKKDNTVKGSRALILGITFKENCPDTRNSKIPQVAKELVSFGMSVDIYDPWSDAAHVSEEFNLHLLTAEPQNHAYDAIILAVSHKLFMNMNIRSLLKNHKKGVIYDIKSVLDRGVVDGRL